MGAGYHPIDEAGPHFYAYADATRNAADRAKGR